MHEQRQEQAQNKSRMESQRGDGKSRFGAQNTGKSSSTDRRSDVTKHARQELPRISLRAGTTAGAEGCDKKGNMMYG